MDVPIRAGLRHVESRLDYDKTKTRHKVIKPSLAYSELLRRNNQAAKVNPKSRGTLVLGLVRHHN